MTTVETRQRSIVKAASYRLFATSAVFLFAGEFGSWAEIGLSAVVAKTVLYYVWERLWSAIEWGVARPDHPTASTFEPPQLRQVVISVPGSA